MDYVVASDFSSVLLLPTFPFLLLSFVLREPNTFGSRCPKPGLNPGLEGQLDQLASTDATRPSGQLLGELFWDHLYLKIAGDKWRTMRRNINLKIAATIALRAAKIRSSNMKTGNRARTLREVCDR